jgi:hypothetical protein
MPRPAPQPALASKKQVFHGIKEWIPAQHLALVFHIINPVCHESEDAGIVAVVHPVLKTAMGKIMGKICIKLPVNRKKRMIRIIRKPVDRFYDIRTFCDGHTGNYIVLIAIPADFFNILNYLAVCSFTPVCIVEFLLAVNRNKDRGETVNNFRINFVQKEAIGLDHETLNWRLFHNPLNQIRSQKGFSSVKCERGGRIPAEETIEQIQINIQFWRKMGIDVDLWSGIFALVSVLKHSGPAVAATKIAIIGEDEVEVQENLITMGFSRR